MDLGWLDAGVYDVASLVWIKSGMTDIWRAEASRNTAIKHHRIPHPHTKRPGRFRSRV